VKLFFVVSLALIEVLSECNSNTPVVILFLLNRFELLDYIVSKETSA
jgi:hypothetical protein